MLAVAAGGKLHYARQDARTCVVDDTLQPIASLLEESLQVIDGLVQDGYAESAATIMEAYLTKIREDCVPRYSAMKQRIDTLANN